MVSEIFQKCVKLFSSRAMPPVMRIKENKTKQNCYSLQGININLTLFRTEKD